MSSIKSITNFLRKIPKQAKDSGNNAAKDISKDILRNIRQNIRYWAKNRTGALEHSWRQEKSGNGYIVYSLSAYAAIHNWGGRNARNLTAQQKPQHYIEKSIKVVADKFPDVLVLELNRRIK